MSNFVDDDLDLPNFPKADLKILQVPAINKFVAVDANAMRQAMLDMKAKIRYLNELIVGAALPGVARDGLSNIGRPSSNAQWATVHAALAIARSAPTSIHLCGDASSPLPDVNNIHNLTAVTGQPGSLTFHNAVAGWAALAAGVLTNPTDTGFSKQHNGLPNPAVNSYRSATYVQLPIAPVTDVGFVSQNDGVLFAGIKTGSNLPMIGTSAGIVGTGSYALPIGTVFPAITHWQLDRQQRRVLLPDEILAIGYAAPSANTGEFLLGVASASGLLSATANYLYNILSTGLGAEMSVTDEADIWSLLGFRFRWHAPPTPVVVGGIYAPLGARQFQALGLAARSHSWGNTSSTGAVQADYIGDVIISTGTSVAFGEQMPGCSVPACKTTDGSMGQYVGAPTDTRLPDLKTTSVALTSLVYIVNGTATLPFGSWVVGMGDPTSGLLAVAVMDTGHLQLYQNGTVTNGSVDHRGKPFHIMFVRDVTNSRCVIYTPYDKILGGSFFVPASACKGVYLGSMAGGVPAANVYYGPASLAEGNVAEFDDAQARAEFLKLGYPAVTW